MAVSEDDERSREWQNAADTVAEAVPEEIAPRDSTGKYKTLQGYQVARELNAGELLRERRFILTGFALAQISSGTHPDVAWQNAHKLERWCEENETLIRVTMRSG